MEELCIKLESKISSIAKSMNLLIYDIIYLKEGGYNYLQIFIEKINGETSLDDCVAFSNAIDSITDDIIPDKFFLEVSTPGLEKKLRKPEHFKSVIGKEINVKTRSNIENSRKFEGILSYANDNLIKIQDKKLEKEILIELDKIKDAKVIYIISDELKGLEE